MAGYFIFELDIFDQAGFEEYRKVARIDLLTRMGGEIVVNSQRIEPLEGDWSPSSIVIARFPTFDAARDFYNSSEYQAVIGMRRRSAKSRGILVESKD